MLAEYLATEGIEIHAGVKIERVERDGSYTVRFQQDGRTGTATAEQLLVATGRRANTEGFGLAGGTVGKFRRARRGLLLDQFARREFGGIPREFAPGRLAAVLGGWKQVAW